MMVALWLLATVILGKAWCSYGCFFGGLDEGFSSIAKKARLRKINPKWRLAPWAILVAIVLLSAATYEPTYCMWLCPFKAVTEFPQVRSTQTALQFGIFIALFLGLVVVLPFLTKRRTQCAFFCPFGAFQSIFSRTSIFDIRIDKEKCGAGCLLCQNNCPTLAIDQEAIRAGKTLSSCMRCGACVDVCRKDAAVWHIKGTPVGVEAGARAAALSLRGVGLCHDVRRQHHRQLAREADWAGHVEASGARPGAERRSARQHVFGCGSMPSVLSVVDRFAGREGRRKMP